MPLITIALIRIKTWYPLLTALRTHRSKLNLCGKEINLRLCLVKTGTRESHICPHRVSWCQSSINGWCWWEILLLPKFQLLEGIEILWVSGKLLLCNLVLVRVVCLIEISVEQAAWCSKTQFKILVTQDQFPALKETSLNSRETRDRSPPTSTWETSSASPVFNLLTGLENRRTPNKFWLRPEKKLCQEEKKPIMFTMIWIPDLKSIEHQINSGLDKLMWAQLNFNLELINL